MTGDTAVSGSLPVTDRQLRAVYVAGIALNAIALLIAAKSGEIPGALTLGVVIVYLCVRYWMLDRSKNEDDGKT